MEITTSLATFRLPPGPGPDAPQRYVIGAPPELAPVEAAVPAPKNDFCRLSQQLDLRLDPRVAGVLEGRGDGVAEVCGYFRFADGREPDLASLLPTTCRRSR